MTAVKAPIAWPNGKAYLFERDGASPATPGTGYIRRDFVSGARDQGVQPIAQAPDPNWPGLRTTRPDAAVHWGFGKVYFFYGKEYLRYDVGKDAVDPEYLPPNDPFTIAGNWNIPWTDGVDAAFNWGNGKIYFFRGTEYLRYDITADRTDENYPKPIAGNWNGVWADRLDGALYQGGAKAYFFKDSQYRRYDVASDGVDDSGSIDSLVLDPVPAGMVTPARDLTLAHANKVMGYLIQDGKLSLSSTQTPYIGDWRTAITSPTPSTRVVIKPAVINNVQLVDDAGAATLIDNVDQRMAVALYRLTRWLNASQPDVTVLRHKGIGHGAGPPNDCHNQGRALDFSGVDGTSGGISFDRKVLRDWGNRPAIPGTPLRLDPVGDPLAHLLFLTAWRFGGFECENNGVGPANKWPGKNIGDVSGMVIHPDYVDVPPPGQQLRALHQNHVHMQIGPTR